ncbi:hypothetical protein BV25DRAFT_1989854 [Artomyces pyxidatus]|uniref:Uncharacterized protein n=1 Tax=Artomyces pyxidatus TaxID=48021 RepID=A0ACB8T742_9AGAM|nr:hypothetical protein BV25DRAFT_1989854 [Artomyces pyxidatus]
MHARVLGFALFDLPDEGRNVLARAINSCQEVETFHQLGQLYIAYFIQPFKTSGGVTPVVSQRPSRPSGESKELIKMRLQNTSKSYAEAKYLALERDNHCCLIIGRVDRISYRNFSTVRSMADAAPTRSFPSTATHCAYITPPSLSTGTGNGLTRSDESDHAASIHTVFMRLVRVFVPRELKGGNVHRLDNVMTLDLLLHTLFDDLSLWFDSTGVPNQYKVCCTDLNSIPLPPTVTFKSSDPALPLPNAAYLAFHATCARVANRSGAGAYVDSSYQDMDRITVLATDGSSAGLLSFALARLEGHS